MATLPQSIDNAITPGMADYVTAVHTDKKTDAERQQWLADAKDFLAFFRANRGDPRYMKYYEYSRAEIFKPYLPADKLAQLDTFVGRIATEPS